jgi:predicted transposase YbfD/YdcC
MAAIPWSSQVVDHRARRGRRHLHHGLLNLLVAAFACGRRTLRRAEDLARDVGKKTRRAWHLPRWVSDSTLYRLLEKQSSAGLRETLHAQAKEILATEVAAGVEPLLPIGVLTTDGKSVLTTSEAPVAGMEQTPCDAEGTPLWRLGGLRAVLTSSPSAPCLDIEFIGAKEGESPAFRTLFPRVVAAFGHLFEVVTGDAGLTAWENADLVISLNKEYFLGLKGNQPTLHEYAQSAFAGQCSSPRALTVERSHGATIRRELWCHSVNGPGQTKIDLPGARQFLCVRQTTEKEGEASAVEWRYFVTSLPSTRLSYQHFLALVRLHWRIENALNWTLDMMLGEDDGAPCEKSREALEVAAWLRALAYNSISAWRARAPLKDRLPISWARAMETLRDYFLHWPEASVETGTRAVLPA